MQPLVLVWLRSKSVCEGKARLIDDSQEWDFADANDFYYERFDQSRATVILAGADAESASAFEIMALWSGGPENFWFADDLAELFDLDVPKSIKQTAEFADRVLARLGDIGDDLLAQMAELVAEAGEQSRLGCFRTELNRRHDVLHQPASGDVDISAYYPAKLEGGAPPRQEVSADILEQVFEAKEKLEESFRRYEERPEQIEMANAVERAIEESRPLVVEAGTGVGKSLAYLLPLAVHSAQTGKLCLVSTNTLNLQQQLVDLDIPRLEQILDNLDLRITLLKGREHYLCVKRLEDLWLRNTSAVRQRRERFMSRSTGTLIFVLRLLLEYAGTGLGDLGEMGQVKGVNQRERNGVLRAVDCNFATCIGERCEYQGNCHFFATRNRANSSHIVITNHALVFALYNPEGTDSDSVVDKASVIVFDEAHNLESAITNQLTLEVNDSMPVELGNQLLGLLQTEGCRRRLELSPSSLEEGARDAFELLLELVPEVPAWVKLAAEIRKQVMNLLEQATAKGHLSGIYSDQLTPATASDGQMQVMELLGRLADRFGAVIQKYEQVRSLLHHLFANDDSGLYIDDTHWQMDLQALGISLVECSRGLTGWQPADPGSICWFNCEPGGGEPAWDYKTAPLKVGPVFQSLLSEKECTVLCSATLNVADSFDYLQSSLGFEPAVVGRAEWLKLDSPFDYREQALLLAANDLATPTGASRDAYLVQLEEVVAGVCDTFARGVLVLFNSYRDLQHIADRLPNHIPKKRILVQGASGPRAVLADRFRKSGDKVLLATRSFWEGFDVSGEALSCVVLAKLPFANFKDPIHAGRQRAINADGGDSFRDYSLPQAAMQLKQGFGRLIRTTTDYGCVFLLDSRVTRANYGKVFMDSLPGPKVFTGSYRECLLEAAQFMEQQNA